MDDSSATPSDRIQPPSPPLPRTLFEWLLVFGPGAIVASMTIGTGELIFSTRGGALFGYRILFLFVIISVLKWGLVIASARHIVLTGVHPYERMLSLPGPRGWLPCMLFLMAAISMPVWVSFHSSVLGNLTSWITDTSGMFGGGIDYLWAAAILASVLVLSATGGYTVLERVQLFIVAALIFCAGATLVLYNPDWLELLKGAVVPKPYVYPDWLAGEYPKIAKHSPWVETTRYVGVIGGAAFDYMAYTSFIREKSWGRAGQGPATRAELAAIAEDGRHPVRQWVRAVYIDSTISFVLIVAFSAVFVASGAMILGPEHKIPDEKNLLNLQAKFVTDIHAALLPLYVTGAVLTMFGTLYGTLEIACSIVLEMIHAVDHRFAATHTRRIRRITITWCAVWAYAVLTWLFLYQSGGGEEGKPRLLLDLLLTPVNLFTGVLACGIFCFVLLWMDIRFLPRALRMPSWLMALNLLSGAVFFALGLKGYWHFENQEIPFDSRIFAFGSLGVVLVAGCVIAVVAKKWLAKPHSPGEQS